MSLQSPEVNHIGLAKVTRKVLDRLAPFCHMKETSLDRTNSTSNEPKMSPFASPLSSPEVSPSPSVSGGDQHSRPVFEAAQTSKKGAQVLSPQARTKLVQKIRARVLKMVGAIDSHIHAAQVAFKMCREGMVLCDEDVRGKAEGTEAAPSPDDNLVADDGTRGAQGPSHRHGKGKQPAVIRSDVDEGWDVDIDPDESDHRGVAAPAHEYHAYGTSGHHFLLHQAHQGLDLAKKTEEAFDAVQQEVYKVAAQTKDHSITVLVPPAPGQEPTVRKQLKDIALDLVANLTLLESGFGRQVKDTVAWWQWVIDDLEKGEQSSLVPLDKTSVGKDQEAMKKAYTWWEQGKEGWQAYYDIIATLHIVYHDLLVSSARAWDGTTVVVKTHQDSDDNLPQSGADGLMTTRSKDAGGNDPNDQEEFERVSVPHRLAGSDPSILHQDAAAGCMRLTGFLTWGKAYSRPVPTSRSRDGGDGGEPEKGKLGKRSFKWTRPWKARAKSGNDKKATEPSQGQEVKKPTLKSRATTLLGGGFKRRKGTSSHEVVA